jgi:hypothetical protein
MDAPRKPSRSKIDVEGRGELRFSQDSGSVVSTSLRWKILLLQSDFFSTKEVISEERMAAHRERPYVMCVVSQVSKVLRFSVFLVRLSSHP